MTMITVKGFSDEQTTCDCCGKSGLKGTYTVEIGLNTFHYGSTCAFKKHGVTKEEMKVADRLASTLKFHGVKTVEEYNAKEIAQLPSINEWRSKIGAPLLTVSDLRLL
jgi:hypothetical protein